MGQRNLSRKAGGVGVSRHRDGEHQGGRGLGGNGTVNPGEVLVKAVRFDKPEGMRKMLSGLNQKGMWPGVGAQRSPAADGVPPAERHDLTRSGIATEPGQPVVRPSGQGTRQRTCWGSGERVREPAKAAP